MADDGKGDRMHSLPGSIDESNAVVRSWLAVSTEPGPEPGTACEPETGLGLITASDALVLDRALSGGCELDDGPLPTRMLACYSLGVAARLALGEEVLRQCARTVLSLCTKPSAYSEV